MHEVIANLDHFRGGGALSQAAGAPKLARLRAAAGAAARKDVLRDAEFSGARRRDAGLAHAPPFIGPSSG